MPQGRIAKELKELIAGLSTKYLTPNFQPHVTLIGELHLPKDKVFSGAKELARKIEPFEITLSEVSYLEEFYRCVFIRACKTKTLMNAHAAACGVFMLTPTGQYMPHLSLMYGNLSSQTKQQIIQDIGDKMDIKFLAAEIHIYYTGGDPEGWYQGAKMHCGRRTS